MWVRRLRFWLRRTQRRRALQEEMELHIAEKTAELRDRGVSEFEAQAEARRRFGNTTRVADEVGDVCQIRWLEDFWRDARYGTRTLSRNLGFTTVAILTLALGIGATAAVYSIVDAALLRPLPYQDPDRLVAIWGRGLRDANISKIYLPYADFEEFSLKAQTLESVSAGSWAGKLKNHVLSGVGPPKQILAIPVSTSFFHMLGVPAALGRTFAAEDERSGCVVVLAHSFWTSSFAADANLIGQSIVLNQQSCTVLGVMPADFGFFPARTQAWLLLEREARITDVGIFARLKPGVTLAEAQAEAAMLHRERHRAGLWRDIEPQVYDLHGEFTFLASRTLRATLIVLFVAVLLVLLIACLNVANLLLARLGQRQRELAVRAALGSGQARLAHQVFVEALLLSVAGTIGGMGVAFAAIRYFHWVRPIELTVGAEVALNLRVFFFTAVLTIGTTLVFGLLPAIRASRIELAGRLVANRRGVVSGDSRHGMARLGIAAQMALSFVLLIGAHLLMSSALRMGTEDLGFEPALLFSSELTLPSSNYSTDEQRRTFYERLQERLARIGGVTGVALASQLPPDAGGYQQIEIQDEPADAGTRPFELGADTVTPSFFDLLQVPILKGRLFDSRDHNKSEPVTIVNQALAERYFANRDPIGQHIRPAASNNRTPWLKIIGVVGNLKHSEPMNEMRWTETPILYRPLAQDPRPSIGIAVRATSTAASVSRDVQNTVAALDSEVPAAELESLTSRVSKLLAYANFRAVVLGFFALTALLLSAVGLHGVLSQMITRRTPELGVRRAVGAQTRDLLILVFVQGGVPVCVGLLCGLVCTIAFSRGLSKLLYGIQPIDLVVLGSVSLTLLAVAALAIAMPATRAAHTDPMVALRLE